MNYTEATQALYRLAPRGMRLGLGRMQRACALRGHPERSLPVIHVAGTNGKGSVVALLDGVLSEAGQRVGAFTSPHLHSYTERFRIAGEPVSRRVLARHASELLVWLEQPGVPRLTFFEVSTLLAFELFREAGCDLALIEVGLGGRLDSTNVVRPWLSVITHIGRDHQERLGSTLPAIAGEKAGIIKRATPVVVGARSPAARRAIQRVAREQHAPAQFIGRDFGADDATRQVWAGEREVRGVRPALAGDHQWDHVATAYACLGPLREHGVEVSAAEFRRGVGKTRWPGRLEWLPGRPKVLLDAAHNPDGARVLADYLAAQRRPRGKVVLLFGAMAHKQVRPMLSVLRAQVDYCVLTRPHAGGAPSIDPAGMRAPGDEVWDKPVQAWTRAQALAGPNGWVVVAGSIFLMAEVRARVLGIRREPSIRL